MSGRFARLKKAIVVGALLAGGSVWALAEVGGLYLFPKGFKLTSNGVPNMQSSVSAASVTSTEGAFRMYPTNVLDANDLILEVMNAGLNEVFTLDYEGDVVLNSLLPNTDIGDSIGSATFTWNNVYAKFYYDQAGTGRMEFQPTDYTALYGASINGASSYGVKLGNQTTLNAAADRFIAGFFRDNNVTEMARVDAAGGFISLAASGANGFKCNTNGCRLDLGDGATDYLTSDGTSVTAAGTFVAVGGAFSGFGISKTGTQDLIYIRGNDANDATAIGVVLSNQTTLNTAGGAIAAFSPDNTATNVSKVYIDGSYQMTPDTTLPTCGTASGNSAPGTIHIFDPGGGARTRVCVCTWDGAGTAAGDYDWLNVTSATVGTETACNI